MTLKLRDYRSSRDVNQGELMISLQLGHNGNATPHHLSKHFSGILSQSGPLHNVYKILQQREEGKQKELQV